jgi:succinate dehydrogenase/fumarate reductase cytochrome b subunit
MNRLIWVEISEMTIFVILGCNIGYHGLIGIHCLMQDTGKGSRIQRVLRKQSERKDEG